ncbi:MFS transporter [Bacillus altitudinis]|uniref:MFS transporter n=1 Tax=Bacillus altitudinis TaxID=293387 RepID=UPI0024C15E8A|nr:MFS transporter [Bacillus altitudinis]WHY04495.1 MFS transporter [Bacillus altitudinis]
MQNKQNHFALLALAISAFAIGTTEFISVGLLPMISEDFGVSVSQAGWTVSLYALGVTFGAPILTSLTSTMKKKTLLLLIMLVFLIGNTLATIAPTFSVLLIGRVISALSHGVFMSIGSTIAASLVVKEKRASAIAFMFTGLTVATVTGVPFGTFLGHELGWRTSFGVIVMIGLIALISNYFLVPSQLKQGMKTTFKDQAALLKTKRILLLFVITATGYGGTFVVFTYLSPLLQHVTGLAPGTVALILLLYGMTIAAGNVIGGKAANKQPMKALIYMFIIQSLILFILSFTAGFMTLGIGTVMLMGLFAFMNVPGLQVAVVDFAERYTPGALDVASALNIAAFNAGIAIGSFLGGIVTDTLGLVHNGWVGGIMVLMAAILTMVSHQIEQKEYKQTI